MEDTSKQIDKILAQGKNLDKQLDDVRLPADQKETLNNEINEVEQQKKQAQKVVVVETQQELSAYIADLNNDRFVGTEVKNDKRYEKLRNKQDVADQEQKDLMNAISRIPDIGTQNKNLLL